MAFNDIHNYSQSQLRNFIVELIKTNQPVPTFEDILACAKRDKVYMTDPEKQKIFDLYVDVLLFKLLGKECWDTAVRHYNCPTDKIDPKDVTSGEYIRVSSEAMVVAIFKNCLDKWKYIADCHKKIPRLIKKTRNSRSILLRARRANRSGVVGMRRAASTMPTLQSKSTRQELRSMSRRWKKLAYNVCVPSMESRIVMLRRKARSASVRRRRKRRWKLMTPST